MFDLAYFTALILVTIRVLTFLLAVNIFFPKGTPVVVKLLLSVAVGFIVLSTLNYGYVGELGTNLGFIFAIINEVGTGLILGFVVNLCFFSIKLAGQLIDFQIGLSMINIFDPSSNTNSTLIEHLFYWFSLITFFIIDGHHILLKHLISSFQIVKIGSLILQQGSIMIVVKAFYEFFALGIKIALPIVLIILMTEIVLGLIARTVPQLNVMILGLPIKILVGMLTIAFALPLLLKLIMSSFNNIPEIYKGFYKTIPLMFIFASEDKTEEATPRKKSDARKKGQVAKSKDVGLALTMLTATLSLSVLGGYVGNSIKNTLYYFLNINNIENIDYNLLNKLNLTAVYRIAITFLPLVLPIMVMGVASNFIQSGFLFTKEPLKPQFSKLNPLNGFKRIFSKRTLVELVKDIAVITVVAFIGYSFVKDNYQDILNISTLKTAMIPEVYFKLVINIFTKITIFMVAVAVLDFTFQKLQYKKDLRMTKQEIKEEYKQDEGDPQIKSKIKQRQREIATRRMMQQVPNATVVVTNPTHLAVALSYEEGKNESPIVVAKGEGFIALKIKEIAMNSEVPIIENKPLARIMYEQVEIDSEIPVELYQAVAEILAIVYKMKKRK